MVTSQRVSIVFSSRIGQRFVNICFDHDANSSLAWLTGKDVWMDVKSLLLLKCPVKPIALPASLLVAVGALANPNLSKSDSDLDPPKHFPCERRLPLLDSSLYPLALSCCSAGASGDCQCRDSQPGKLKFDSGASNLQCLLGKRHHHQFDSTKRHIDSIGCDTLCILKGVWSFEYLGEHADFFHVACLIKWVCLHLRRTLAD